MAQWWREFDPISLDDELLERALREALVTACADHDGCLQGPCKVRVEALRAEARRRYAGKLGLPAGLMGEGE